jgi:hypothetical protein
MPDIELATVLLGASGFKEGNVNDTFRGQVMLADQSVRQAVIKDLDLIQLCNELMAFALARHVGLPIPDCYIGLVRPGVLNVSKGPVLPDSSRLVFISADVKVPNLTHRLTTSDAVAQAALYGEVAIWPDLGKLYAFDAWIANIDRHPGNLLFGGPGEAWLIDHGHSFTGPAWTPADLNPLRDVSNRLQEWMTPILTSDQKTQRRAEAVALGAGLAGFNADVTSKSCRVNELLPVDFTQALKGFVEGRASTVGQFASKALGVPVMV